MLCRSFAIATCILCSVQWVVAIAQTPIFEDGFEDAETFMDLFPPDGSRWTNFGITADGNTLDLSQEVAHTGTQSLRCHAEPYDGVTASKAYISNGFLRFVEGDEAWFELWVFVEGSTRTPDLFLWDLESTGTCTDADACPEEGDGTICPSPGRRLYLQDSNGTPLRSDLGKWCLGEDFVQQPGQEVPFPTDRWVRLRVFIGLSSRSEGVMQVWQDDHLVLTNRGYTLPRHDSTYDRLQVGITANGSTMNSATIFLDDVAIWDAAPAWWLAIFDRDADGTITNDDLHEQHQHGADLNGDGRIDHSDTELLEMVLRWNELRDMRAGR
jgi:hypothetical protein